MISISGESLVSLRDARGVLPRRASGRAVHLSSLYRWAARGIRGVRLEALRVGGCTYTSREALQRFAERLSSAPKAVAPASPGARRKVVARATRLAEMMLAPGPSA